MNEPISAATVRTIDQARDPELRKAALLAIGAAGCTVRMAPGTGRYLTVWHTADDGPALDGLADRFGLRHSL